ncbi:MAG: transglycosylase SLT domain-containing protein [candidate division Zixibacteria bacterium]|nr:transglycosylase SLT domain-containing protein [candidate division Zixibacteria bacterium]
MGSEIFTQLFDEGLADKMAESGPFGIGDMLIKSYAERMGIDPEKVKTYDKVMPDATYYRPYIKVKPVSEKALDQGDRLSNLDELIERASGINNVDPKLIKAVIMQESGGNPKAISSKGAKGLMQLMDGTARMLGVSNPFDVKQNINAGVKYLSSLIKKFNGNIENALAAYNAGPGVVDKYGGMPPYEETKKYVKNIMDKLEG